MNLVEETIAAGRAKDRTRFTALWVQLAPSQRLEVEAAARLNMIRRQARDDDRPAGATSPDPRQDPRMRRCAVHDVLLYPGEICNRCNATDPAVECPRCGGHGKDKQGRPCSVCKGEGEIPRDLLYGDRP